jgi:hypothetical protein
MRKPQQEESRDPKTRRSYNHSVKRRTGVIAGRSSGLGRVRGRVHLKSRNPETRFPDHPGSVGPQARAPKTSGIGDWRIGDLEDASSTHLSFAKSELSIRKTYCGLADRQVA